MLVKLCGFTDVISVAAAIEQKCDFLGFIFHEKSPRFITPAKAHDISKKVPSSIKKVAVVVDKNLDQLAEISEIFSPDIFQFHGKETPGFLKEVRQKFPQVKIIKAFQVNSAKDLEHVRDFDDVADFFMFDSSNGGSGKKFDWEILKGFSSNKTWFLCGGLNARNIEEAVRITGAPAIDISSGIEEIRGKKSIALIEEFMTKIRKICS